MEPQPGCSTDPDFPMVTSYHSKNKTRRILEQYIKDSQNISAENTINYVYHDADTVARELAELYSYSEDKDFTLNVRAFEDFLTQFKLLPSWEALSSSQKENIILLLLNQLETNSVVMRMDAARCILYIAQGCWADLHSSKEQIECIRAHVMLLYRLGTFSTFIDLLKIQVAKFHDHKKISRNDSEQLRVILNVLYTITEIFRYEDECEDSPYHSKVEWFRSDVYNDSLIIILFDMMVIFTRCDTRGSYFPIKKLLLLLWKLILVSLGNLDTLEKTKRDVRVKNGLPAQHDPVKPEKYEANLHLDDLKLKLEDILGVSSKSVNIKIKKRPKVRQEEHNEFLDEARIKYIGYSLLKDHTTTTGLPHSVLGSMDTIRKHLYVPLAQSQIEKESAVKSHPLTNPENIEMTATEQLYQQMFPNFKEYIIGLIKILLFVVPQNERKTFTCLPKISEIPPDGIIYSLVLNIDMFRHEEIILKATSAIILLLLKHLKLNHIYQFEFMCQCLVFNNIVPVLMNFFDQNISAYVKTLNEISVLEFPFCVMEVHSEITIDALNLTNSDSFSSRNMFLCINLLRILNKITKWKPTRIAQLVLADSKSVLSRLILVNNEMFKLYALKLLKMQMKYLGKTWRKNNMKVLTEIYLNVRLHLNDNFLNHSSVEAFQTTLEENEEEILLRNKINVFNRRRYSGIQRQNDVSKDNCIRRITKINMELPQCLKNSLRQWLQQEVLS